MTTQTWSTVIDHSSDANFRIWGNELKTKLAAAGLVQTADTGQINWVTVTRPATNTDAGYEIWRMNDTQQATAPIFFKIFYGTANGAGTPRIRVQMGQGSNGSGTLTGIVTTVQIMGVQTAPNTAVAYPSYACAAQGFFGLAWKVGGGPQGGFFLCRTADPAGSNAPTADGAYFVIANSSGTFSAIHRYASPAGLIGSESTTVAQIPCVVPGRMTTTAVGSDIQVFPHFFGTPRVYPAFGLCTVVKSELPLGNTFSATLLGSTAHTFIALDIGIGDAQAGGGSANYAHAMLWE
jgi:hypothetical protein